MLNALKRNACRIALGPQSPEPSLSGADHTNYMNVRLFISTTTYISLSYLGIDKGHKMTASHYIAFS